MDYRTVLNEIYSVGKVMEGLGNVATYIPELSNVDPDKFGIYLLTLDRQGYGIGDDKERFSIQSISKIFTVSMAIRILGESVWKRVGVEPSGSPFNSMVQLEYEKGYPRNPLINPGALVIADMLISNLANPKEDLLDFVRMVSGYESITFDEKVAESEKRTGFRNAAMAYMLKAFNNLDNDIDTVLDFYFHQCSITMSCKELASAFFYFANKGYTYDNSIQILTESKVKRLNALMQTCGFYDESGEFAYKVGLPGKSGVGGGIIAIYPGRYTVATWSPRLNSKGNSVRGMKALEMLTTFTTESIF
ncbi:MAG TPA: glutaminase [Saprospiraceae bacterium]|jgi:glutaminase|nr:MAG: glutaminase A [Candidatus Parvibacillus calidus]MCC7149886.1 glutaminase [Saprospiraceae bacterium]WKZ62313.1 MAG: glutaminase [Saprospiraceae bacterium]HQN56476.1 glutaminase [Saprospiraceae bacterium]HQP75796.1 glutaminase [Saprospiraceae bacterium]